MSTPIVPPIPSPNTTNWKGAGAVPKFLYVYHESAEDKGKVRQWSDTAAWLGVGVEDTVANSTRVAGVTAETVSAAGWGWIQSAGICDYITTDGSVAAPNADTLQGDIGLLATAAEVAAGATAAELDGTAGLYKSCFATNLAADASTVGVCILHCNYH